MSERRRILVVANETVAGMPLIDAVKRRADAGPVEVHVICPQNTPKHGLVIYDDTVRQAAANRLHLTLAQLREAGIEATGEVVDPDPYTAVMDALRERRYDEIIISTHPQTRSGWLRQGLVDRVRGATTVPVEHVVVDLDHEREQVKRTLVVANRTVASEELLDLLKTKAREGRRRFIVLVPLGSANGTAEAQERLARMLELLRREGLEAIGQVVHPDPYTAVRNALQFYDPDEIVISTFPEARSGWLRADLVNRVRQLTSRPVEHVVADVAETPAEVAP